MRHEIVDRRYQEHNHAYLVRPDTISSQDRGFYGVIESIKHVPGKHRVLDSGRRDQ